jgi:hypothetical protein
MRELDEGKPGARGGFPIGIPALEAFMQVAIEGLGSGWEQEVSTSFSPAHLLFLDHAAGQHLWASMDPGRPSPSKCAAPED